MDRGNVLVIGNSGVGKSTLINAVLGEEKAKVGWGTSGTTNQLEIYESDSIPFRIIDTIGFEPSFLKEMKAINAVKKWSKECAKKGKDDHSINLIWFCIDGTSRKLFSKSIDNLLKATSIWKSVPIIVVITKSYALYERKDNIQMVYDAFSKHTKHIHKLKHVIPVVADPYIIDEHTFVSPTGITDLIDASHALMPEGIKAGIQDLNKFKLNRKRAIAQSIVASSVVSGVIVGLTPIPFSDAVLLGPIEITEINAIALTYGIKSNDRAKEFMNSIKEVGTISIAARSVISALKAIPGINLSAAVLNSIIAGSIIGAIGEGSAYAFEQVYLGNKTLDDIDWVRHLIESKLSSGFIQTVTGIIKGIGNNPNQKTISDAIMNIFKVMNKK